MGEWGCCGGGREVCGLLRCVLALCADVDECAEGADGCGEGTCTNAAGGYVCSNCPAGYLLSSDASACVGECPSCCTDGVVLTARVVGV